MTEILLVAAFPLAVAGLIYSASVSHHRALHRMWSLAARRAGLIDVVRSSPLWFGGLSGVSHGLRVALTQYTRKRKETYESGTRITICGDSGLTLRPEVLTGLERIFGAREIEIGDAAFDDEVWVLGAPEVARAVLDAETRKELRVLLGGVVRMAGAVTTMHGSFSVVDGEVQAELRDREGLSGPEALAGALETLLAMARRLQRPADVVDRIADNTLREPEWEVRLNNLLLLAESFPGHARTPEVLRRGCEDEREEVQLAAALSLDDEQGRLVLLEIASREWSGDSFAARAIAGLGEALPADRARAILSHALRTRRIRTARACLEALGRSGGSGAVETLAKVLAVENGDLGVAAAQALGACRQEAAEGPLLRALSRAPAAVRVAAAEALGRVGSARAVLPLKDVADAADSDAALRRAARQAVAEIQSRLQGASPGQLSLAVGDAGQLSLADQDPRGRVSIASTRGDD